MKSPALLSRLIPCLLAMVLSGCAQFKQAISDPKVQEELSLDVQTAVSGTIAFSRNPAAEARQIINVATKVREIADSDVMASDVRQVLTDVALKRVEAEDRPKVRFLVDLIFLQVKRRLNVDLTLIPVDQLPETRKLVIKLCDAAITAATPYLSG